MSSSVRLLVAVALCAPLTACGGKAASTSTTAPSTAPTSSSVGPASSSPSTAGPTSSSSAVTTIAVVVRGGAVQGGVRREQVALGKPARLMITSDVEDEVHVHGYDKTGDVGPNAPLTLDFVADIPGVFEVELESRHLKLLDLEVK